MNEERTGKCLRPVKGWGV